MLRQVVEIGVSEINIINADHSVSKIDINSTSSKALRFSKIIDEALKQSGNQIVPKINFIIIFLFALFFLYYQILCCSSKWNAFKQE